MNSPLVAATAIAILAGSCVATPSQAQSGSNTELAFVHEKEEKTREQLRRLLTEYDLDPWIFTRLVKVESGVSPHSKPVLTLNWKYLDDDERQLSVFVHEQIHWFLGTDRASGWRAAMDDLRARYSNAPKVKPGPKAEPSKHITYLHLIVNWLELDAMIQLVGKGKAREIMSTQNTYEWIYERVLQDTDEIGAILAEHDLLITPREGLVVNANEQ